MYQLKKFYKKYQLLVIPMVMISFSILIFLYGIWPAVQYIQQGFDENKQLLTNVEAMEKRVTLLSGLDESGVEQDMRDMLTAVPPEKNVSSIIATLESASDKSGVALTELTIQTPGSIATDAASANKRTEETKLGTSILGVSIGVQGKQENIQAFIEGISSVRRLFRTTQVQIDFSSSTGGARGQFTLDTFYLPFPKTLGNPTDTIAPLTAAEQLTIEKIRNYTLYSSTVPTQAETGESKENPFSPL